MLPRGQNKGVAVNTSNISRGVASFNGETGYVTAAMGGVISFNTRTGAISLESSDITTALGFTPGQGTVNSVSIVTANGLSGTVANPTTAPAITLSLGAINPSSVGATTAGQVKGYRPLNLQSALTYTLALSDNGSLVGVNTSASVSLIIPNTSSIAFPLGAEVDIAQLGSGSVTVNTASGVTVNSYGALFTLAGQYAAGTLKLVGTNSWLLVGNL